MSFDSGRLLCSLERWLMNESISSMKNTHGALRFACSPADLSLRLLANPHRRGVRIRDAEKFDLEFAGQCLRKCGLAIAGVTVQQDALARAFLSLARHH